MARRILSLWFTRLPTDRMAQQSPDLRDRPLALVGADRGRLVLQSVNLAAEQAGVLAGCRLADARALLPDLEVRDADPAGDRATLLMLADWCDRYSPWVALDDTDGLALDITGGSHLFGGDMGLLRDVTQRLDQAGLAVRAALADSPAAAWALARFGSRHRLVSPPGGQRALLDPLPMAALRLDHTVVDGLAAVGLRRVADLHAIPRATLVARFGPLPARRLDQALGWLDDPLSPRRPAARHEERLAFADAIATAPALGRATSHLLDRLCAGLEQAGTGARHLTLTAHRIDRKPDEPAQRIKIGTGRPVRTPAPLFRLFAQKLERLTPGPGFEVLVLSADVVESLGARQLALTESRVTESGVTGNGGAGNTEDLVDLVDRLGNRLGDMAVRELKPRSSWLPERAVAPVELANPPRPPLLLWPIDRPRPIRLLARPEPIAVMAPVPDDPPVMFHWRGIAHRIRRAEGPERIAAEWWRHDGEPRDYYRVEDGEGRRFWVYRLGLYRPEEPAPWFLHGFFA